MWEERVELGVENQWNRNKHINKQENTKKLNEIKNWFFEKINKTDKS